MRTQNLHDPNVLPPARLSLSEEAQFVRGAGPVLLPLLAKLGLRTVRDLLRHVPRRYEDRTRLVPIGQARPPGPLSLRGRVLSAENIVTSRRNMIVTRVIIEDGSAVCQLTFFNQPYLERVFQKIVGAAGEIIAFGPVKWQGPGFPIEMSSPEWEDLDRADPLSINRIVPIYPATEGLPQKRLRRIIYNAVEAAAPGLPDTVPDLIRHKHKLLARGDAYLHLHFPRTMKLREEAKRRLVFEEFFLAQVAIARRRALQAARPSKHQLSVDLESIREDLRSCLGFELTGAQWRAICDIANDVKGAHPMNRLIQGDVGAGKTAVALGAILMAVRQDRQAAIMAPTEILAQQHHALFQAALEPLGIRVDLATGTTNSRNKEHIRAALVSGVTQVAVGTHALIQEGVEFHRLGLAIIDEQHRFGVMQRQALSQKGEGIHLLSMTATPIPRTLVMTLYGDLDVSILDELPPGRRPVRTHVKTMEQRRSVYTNLAKLLAEGRQAYIVCPLVEESDKLQAKAATQLGKQVSEDLLPNFRVGVLHGQLKPSDRDHIMDRFKRHELDVLVCTTVIEVGVDVPNATIMVVEDAERFGLSQLHQLRGRVARSSGSAFCILIAESKTESSEKRLTILAETTDGFLIAEEDLRIRGPGEYLGTRQSGLPDFRFGDLVNDRTILELARTEAITVIATDPSLKLPENRCIRAGLAESETNADRLAS